MNPDEPVVGLTLRKNDDSRPLVPHPRGPQPRASQPAPPAGRKWRRPAWLIATVLVAVGAVGAVLFMVTPDTGKHSAAVAAAPASQRPPADREDPNAWPPQHGTVPSTGPLPVLPLAAPPDAPLPLDQSGPEAPMVYRIPTDKKIVFLTMDDGTTQTPVATQLYKQTRLPVTIFLISHTGAHNPRYFKQLTKFGGVIQDHTLTHPKLNNRPAAFQHNQLCRSANQLKDLFGTRPTLFRPPYGLYDHNTLKIAHQCGYHAVVMWEASMIGGHMYISNHGTGPKNTLLPGMIILMHFTPRFNDDYRNMLATIKAKGYSVGRLSDYLK